MQRLTLDFESSNLAPAWTGWTLLAVAILFFVHVCWSLVSAKENVAQREAALVSQSGRYPAAAIPDAAADGKGIDRRLAYARSTIDRLSVPWQDLLQALEEARIENVALLAMEPDADAGTVVLKGEAKDIATLLTYLAQLRATKILREVVLLRQEIKSADPQQPILFSASALWKHKN